MKSDFQSSQGLVQLNGGLCRSVIILVCSEAELFFDLGRLYKKYLTRCQISRSKSKLSQFNKSGFQSSQGLVQLNRGSM